MPSALANQHVLLGVTGSIAAYKSPEIIRRLREQGAEVRVVMTQSACEFITPLTLQAVCDYPVRIKLFDEQAEQAMSHIELARWADTILIAPASANSMARVAQGIADDLLSTVCLATKANIVIAPAMNQQMWASAATQQNLKLLTEQGVTLIGPDQGSQACGDVGPGRMCEPSEIVECVLALPDSKFLAGKKIVITAGPTVEQLDPVRFLSNFSSGKMGYALARAAQLAGAEVVLISGPTHLCPPVSVNCISVTSAEQMHQQVMQHIEGCDVFIAAAAVANYRVKEVSEQKIKSNTDQLQINLIKNHDIVADVAQLKNKPFVIGFAAETEQVIEHAKLKMQRKKLDAIIANQVGNEQGFAVDHNQVSILFQNGQQTDLQLQSKSVLAKEILEAVLSNR